jgi:formamidopyrimidine-DNA glycosylase
MPELPDVEGFRRHYARYAQGKRLRSVQVLDPVLLRNATPQTAARRLNGRQLGRARRWGKWLMIPVGDTTVLLHFGMTGLLKWSSSRDGRPHRHDRLLFETAGGTLSYRNMRRFGGVWLARNEEEIEKVTGPLGPDAMEVQADQLAAMLGGRRGGIKAALMDQRLIAGIGNLLCDEVLWRSHIHPNRRASELSEREVRTLDRELRQTIAACNRRGRIPGDPGWLTRVRGIRDAECPRCGARLERGKVAGRTACWCPRCQTA